MITQGSDTGETQSLIYDSPKNEPAEMELLAFENRTTWLPQPLGAKTFIAEIKDTNKFWLFTANMGKADWDNPLEYIRCDQT